MDKRKLGSTGFEVAPLAFGGNVFGWTADEPTSFALLDAFVGAGFNLIDTADSYSRWVTGHQGGESETIIGRWIARRGRHDDVIVATKVGSDMGQGHKVLAQRLHRAGRRSIVTPAAGRLHRPLPVALGRREHAVRGNARRISKSSFGRGRSRRSARPTSTAARLAQALDVSRTKKLPRYATLQPHYNLYERQNFEAELQPLCVRENIGVITYFSLAAGFLTGKYRSESDFGKSARGPGMKKYLNPRGIRILDALDASRGASMPRRLESRWRG